MGSGGTIRAVVNDDNQNAACGESVVTSLQSVAPTQLLHHVRRDKELSRSSDICLKIGLSVLLT